MAFSRSNIPTQKLFSVVLVIFTAFFLLLAREVDSVSFNFPKFTPDDLILQNEARIDSDGRFLNLTRPDSLVIFPQTGRALYKTPVPIWDSDTGNVASFVTSFSFLVERLTGSTPGDGIIFFLAPPDTTVPSNSEGGKLGVVDGNTAFNQFVGVEFDNFVNDWDPDYAHIGIDVNSVISLKTVPWNWLSGSLVNVSIIYESKTKTLSVAVIDKNGRIYTVGQVVDLKAVLPETVRVGLSATITSGGRQRCRIYSWSFTSTLETTDSSTSESINNIASYA